MEKSYWFHHLLSPAKLWPPEKRKILLARYLSIPFVFSLFLFFPLPFNRSTICFLPSILTFLLLISCLREIGWPSLLLVLQYWRTILIWKYVKISMISSTALQIALWCIHHSWGGICTPSPAPRVPRLPACEAFTLSELSTGRISGKKKNLSYTLEKVRFFFFLSSLGVLSQLHGLV